MRNCRSLVCEMHPIKPNVIICEHQTFFMSNLFQFRTLRERRAGKSSRVSTTSSAISPLTSLTSFFTFAFAKWGWAVSRMPPKRLLPRSFLRVLYEPFNFFAKAINCHTKLPACVWLVIRLTFGSPYGSKVIKSNGCTISRFYYAKQIHIYVMLDTFQYARWATYTQPPKRSFLPFHSCSTTAAAL